MMRARVPNRYPYNTQTLKSPYLTMTHEQKNSRLGKSGPAVHAGHPRVHDLWFIVNSNQGLVKARSRRNPVNMCVARALQLSTVLCLFFPLQIMHTMAHNCTQWVPGRPQLVIHQPIHHLPDSVACPSYSREMLVGSLPSCS